MYNIKNYYVIGTTETEDDLRSTNHYTVRTVIHTNGKNYMINESHWQSYVGTRQNRVFLEDETDFQKYAGTHFIKGIDSIKKIRKDAVTEYTKELKAFREHMLHSMDVLMGDACTDETINAFYNSKFEITWRGKTISLCNGADVFQGIESILENEIDENEEVQTDVSK